MSGITKPVLSSEAVEALAARIATAVVVGLAESGIIGITQQPQAAAPAKRSASPKAKATSKPRTTSKTRSAKPISTAQHSKGSTVELVFGIRADGTLTPNQQTKARQFFGERSEAAAKALGKTVTMRSIVRAVQIVNGNERGEGSTLRYWAVWNAPSGRLSDYEARQLLRSSKA